MASLKWAFLLVVGVAVLLGAGPALAAPGDPHPVDEVEGDWQQSPQPVVWGDGARYRVQCGAMNSGSAPSSAAWLCAFVTLGEDAPASETWRLRSTVDAARLARESIDWDSVSTGTSGNNLQHHSRGECEGDPPWGAQASANACFEVLTFEPPVGDPISVRVTWIRSTHGVWGLSAQSIAEDAPIGSGCRGVVARQESSNSPAAARIVCVDDIVSVGSLELGDLTREEMHAVVDWPPTALEDPEDPESPLVLDLWPTDWEPWRPAAEAEPDDPDPWDEESGCVWWNMGCWAVWLAVPDFEETAGWLDEAQEIASTRFPTALLVDVGAALSEIQSGMSGIFHDGGGCNPSNPIYPTCDTPGFGVVLPGTSTELRANFPDPRWCPDEATKCAGNMWGYRTMFRGMLLVGIILATLSRISNAWLNTGAEVGE